MQRPLQMDTTEQVLPLPSHSEVLPSLPCVSACLRVRTHMCPAHTCTHMPISSSHHILLLSLNPFPRKGGTKKSSLLVSYFFLRLLIMPLICSPLILLILIWFFWFHFCIFPTLFFFFLECGKLEGDLILCPFQGDGEGSIGLLPGPGPGVESRAILKVLLN